MSVFVCCAFSPLLSVLPGHCPKVTTSADTEQERGLVNWLMISRSRDTTELFTDAKIIKPLQLPSAFLVFTLLRSASVLVYYLEHLKTLLCRMLSGLIFRKNRRKKTLKSPKITSKDKLFLNYGGLH